MTGELGQVRAPGIQATIRGRTRARMEGKRLAREGVPAYVVVGARAWTFLPDESAEFGWREVAGPDAFAAYTHACQN